MSSAKNTPAEPGADAAQAASDAASVKVEQGIVKFYFASGKADPAPGAGQALADMVRGPQSGCKLVISGFHDATGNVAKNAALARQRALAVRDALKALGVAEQQIEIRKPEPLTSSRPTRSAYLAQMRADSTRTRTRAQYGPHGLRQHCACRGPGLVRPPTQMPQSCASSP